MKIIAVDDEPVIAHTLGDILKGVGYSAISASNGESAVEWSEKFQPDMVVSDVIMPVSSGIDTAKAILSRVANCRIIPFLRRSRKRGSGVQSEGGRTFVRGTRQTG